MPNDGDQWVSDLGKMSGVPTPKLDARISGGSSAVRSAGAANTKLTQDELAYAYKTMDEYQKDIDKAQTAYQAAKGGAEQLTDATGKKFDDPGKDLAARTDALKQAIAAWTKALQTNNRDAATKARAATNTAHDAMMQVVAKYENAIQSAKPNTIPGKRFHTDWGDLTARDDKGAATALSLAADLKKALGADYANFDRFIQSRDMLDQLVRIKPMSDFLEKPESVQAAVQKSAEDSKGKVNDAREQARHADRLESEDEDLTTQLATVKTLVDQMTENVAAIAKQIESDKASEESAELKEKAERIEGAFEFMGEVATCLTNPKEAASKLGELALKTGFKLLGKLATKDIRDRADELQKVAHDKHKQSLEDQTNALISALDKFDKIAPGIETKINALAKRFETQMKSVGDKFDNVCESCTFHFYDIDNAIKEAHKALDAAATGRQALDDNALGLPDAINRAVMRTAQEIGGLPGQVQEKAYKEMNGPTIDMARHAVEQRLDSYKSNEQKITASLGQLLEVRQQALQALADSG